MMGFKELSVSSGSACTSASLEPSYVLRALGVDEELAHTSIRFGIGRFTTPEEIDYTIDRGPKQWIDCVKMSPYGKWLKKELISNPLNGQLIKLKRKESKMVYSRKVIDHYEKPLKCRSF